MKTRRYNYENIFTVCVMQRENKKIERLHKLEPFSQKKKKDLDCLFLITGQTEGMHFN